jgi:pyruvate formate lyase activating enzyme
VFSLGELEELSDEVWSFLLRRRGLLEGVVFSGGEPTLHSHLPALAEEIRALGYRVKLDTNGLLPEAIERISPDYLALDVKALPGDYGRLLGARVPDVRVRLMRSIEIARGMGERAEVRITVAPGVVGSGVVRRLAPMLAGVRNVFLQPMNARHGLLDPSHGKAPPVGDEEMRECRDILARVVDTCSIRGHVHEGRVAETVPARALHVT